MSKDRLNIKKIYLAGETCADEEYAKRNIGREEDLRGGNAGARIWSTKSKKFKSIGKCPRVSLLRAKGVEGKKDFRTKLMFDGGFGSEEFLMKKLEMGFAEGKMIHEGELVCEWELPSGRKITGTPDGILATAEGVPLEGIEAKCMSSGYTVLATGIKHEPRTPHLIQTAQYSMALGIPFQLVYVSRVNYEVGGYMYSLLGDEQRPWFKLNKDLTVRALAPNMAVFLLEWDEDGRLYYKHSSDSVWVRTVVTKEAIVEYYRHVDECLVTAQIPDKVTAVSATNGYCYNECDYCEFDRACRLYGNTTYEEWFQACKDLSE